MKRNLKALGLALIAVLAMSAFAAASASAKYDSEVETTYTHGQQTTNHVFTTNAGNVTCKKATFSGEQKGTWNGASYTASTITVTPSYDECTAFGFSAKVHVNGCQYEFGAPSELKASTKILCPVGKQIEITAIGFCTMTVGAQSPGGSVSFTNEGAGTSRDVKVTSSVTGIVYAGNCGSGSNGTYSGTTTVKGYSDSLLTKQVGIWVTS